MNTKDAIELARENAKNDPRLKALRDKGQTLYITAIYDKKAEVYQNFNVTPSCAYAVRGLIDATKDEKSVLNKYAEDFRLDLLGTFDTKSGEIVQSKPETLLEAASVVVKTNN